MRLKNRCRRRGEDEEDFVAGPAAYVVQRRAQRAGGVLSSMPKASGVLFDSVAIKGGENGGRRLRHELLRAGRREARAKNRDNQ